MHRKVSLKAGAPSSQRPGFYTLYLVCAGTAFMSARIDYISVKNVSSLSTIAYWARSLCRFPHSLFTLCLIILNLGILTDYGTLGESTFYHRLSFSTFNARLRPSPRKHFHNTAVWPAPIRPIRADLPLTARTPFHFKVSKTAWDPCRARRQPLTQLEGYGI